MSILVNVDFEIEQRHFFFVDIFLDELIFNALVNFLTDFGKLIEIFIWVSALEEFRHLLAHEVKDITAECSGCGLIDSVDGVVADTHHGRDKEDLVFNLDLVQFLNLLLLLLEVFI